MVRGRYLPIVGWLIMAAGPWGSAFAADAATCDALSGQFEARKTTLEAPQISAALFASADNGCDALATRLLDSGASVAARDRMGGTALTHAARGGHEPVVQLLLARGAEINLRTVEGATPLFVATEQNRLGAARVLIEHGADVNIPGRAGVTPLAAAAYNGNLELVELLLAHRADPAVRDLSGKVPIVYAAARGFAPIVTRLLAAGADVNTAYGNDLTLLMWAAGYADDVPVDDGVALVGMLLDRGAALDAQDDRGRTALMTAAELGHGEVVDLLLRRGARADMRDKAGKGAADLTSSTDIRSRLAALPTK